MKQITASPIEIYKGFCRRGNTNLYRFYYQEDRTNHQSAGVFKILLISIIIIDK